MVLLRLTHQVKSIADGNCRLETNLITRDRPVIRADFPCRASDHSVQTMLLHRQPLSWLGPGYRGRFPVISLTCPQLTGKQRASEKPEILLMQGLVARLLNASGSNSPGECALENQEKKDAG